MFIKLKNNILVYIGYGIICAVLFFIFFQIGAKIQIKNIFADTRNASGDTWADIILGQTDFTQGAVRETTAFKVGNPGGTWVDRTQHPNVLYVSDSINSRILGYKSLGVCSNDAGIACTTDNDCGGGNTCNLTPTLHCNGTQDACSTDSDCSGESAGHTTCVPINADFVIGQSDFTHSSCNHDISYSGMVFPTPSAATLCSMPPSQISPGEGGFYASFANDSSSRLYFPDWINNRILMYDNPATQVGTITATAVWGQNDFSGHECNKGSAPDNTSICLGEDFSFNPSFSASVDIDSTGALWVVDTENNRVLRFPYDSGTGMPALAADLVLGQQNFSDNGEGQGLAQLNYPGAVRVADDGTVYVADTVNHRIMKYSGALTTGMDGVIWGSGFGNYPSSGSSGPTGIEFERDTSGALTGNIWVNNYNAGGTGNDRVELWNAAGDTVLNALYTDVYPNAWNPGINCGSDITPVNAALCFQSDSRGSIGISDHGDLFIAGSSNDQQVLHFKAPIPVPSLGGPYTAADFKLYQEPDYANWETSRSLEVPTGLTIYNGAVTQLIVSDGFRILFWNNPISAANGQAADGVVGAADGHDRNPNAYGRIATDNAGHLYVLHNDGNPTIEIFNLPLTNGTTPSIVIETNTLQDLEGDTIDLSINSDLSTGGIFPSSDGNYVWVAHPGSSRVVRIRNPLTTPKVDIVLGQPNATSTDANQGGSASALTLYNPGSVVLDKNNNVFVSDNSLEVTGNGRMLEFNNSSLTALVTAAAGSTVFDPPADKTIIPMGEHPFEPAFDSHNNMVVGYNSYPGHTNANHSLDYFDNVLNDQNPTGIFNDYYAMPYSLAFDSNNNLYVSDINRNKVLIYESPLSALYLETPTPTPTSTETPTPTPGNPGNQPPPSCNNPAPPTAPNLFSAKRNGNKATLTFTPVNVNETGYSIMYGYFPGDDRFATLFAQGYSSGALPYTIGELEPNHAYYFKVRAVNDCVPGPWSNYLSVNALTVTSPQPTPTLSPTPVSTTTPVSTSTPTSTSTPIPAVDLITTPFPNPEPREPTATGVSPVSLESLGETAKTVTKVGTAVTGVVLIVSALAGAIATIVLISTALLPIYSETARSLIVFPFDLVQSIFAGFLAWLAGFFAPIFGFIKRKSKQGIIFDGLSGKPLAGAYVLMFSESGNLRSGFTDPDGQYSLKLRPDSYFIRAEKNNYIFPSKLVTVSVNEIFNHIYQPGEKIEIKSEEENISDIAVPLDPNTNISILNAVFTKISNYNSFIIKKFGVLLAIMTLAISGFAAYSDTGYFYIAIFLGFAIIYLFQLIGVIISRLKTNTV